MSEIDEQPLATVTSRGEDAPPEADHTGLTTAARAFIDAAGLLDRKAGPGLLVEWFTNKRLTKADMRDVVHYVWVAAEWPQRALGIDLWVWFFQMAAYPQPPGPLTLYRGTTQGRCRGMSWTTDLDKARWFARRFGLIDAVAYVFVVTAPPQAVLADIDGLEANGGRHEHEIVVDPRRLPRVRRLIT